MVEGKLSSYALDEDPAKRDVTLRKPIRITEKDQDEVQWLDSSWSGRASG